VTARSIDPNARLGSQRDSVVVCVLIRRSSADLGDCLRAVDDHTAAEVPILVCDPNPDGRVLESIRDLELARDRELVYMPVGSAGTATAIDIAAPADLVLLGSDCTVAEHWLAGLREAAQADSRIATATPLTIESSADLAIAAAVVRSRSLALRPRIPSADCVCMYVRRPALELVGGFDPASADERRDFSQRCALNGLAHVLADDVLVCVPGRADFTTESPDPGPLTRALSRARRSLSRPSVVIDARIVSSPAPGTRVQVLEMIAALARTEKLQLAVVLPSDLGADVARRIEALPDVTTLTYTAASREAERRRADIVHRPFQVSNAADFKFVAGLGDRLVITHQDLISYFNPSYFPSLEAWEGYRQLTRGVLSTADRVLFFSPHAREDALAEELVEPQRASVVRIGVDHYSADTGQPTRPKQATRLPDRAEVILSIGTDFRHKNRVFALRMLAELQRRHGWSGYLLFAGPSVKIGSSKAEEAQLLASDPRIADAVIDCGSVTEEEKAWLLQRARLVVYPTVHEGFGLVPFEAAGHGVACMWAAGTSLSELLPDAQAGIVRWDAAESAARALELMRDEVVRERNIGSVREAGAGLTWDATAARLIEEYDATCDSPAMPASALERQHGRVAGALTEDGMRLVGAGGALPADVERPLLALATHPQIGGPVFGALKLGYRVSHKLHRGGRDNPANLKRPGS
jgi:glycosyltransferase involved in cell wall biosynthesis